MEIALQTIPEVDMNRSMADNGWDICRQSIRARVQAASLDGAGQIRSRGRGKASGPGGK